VARLQTDAFWTFENAAARALRGSKWMPNELLDRYIATKDDVYLMADVLDREAWILYSSAVRAQAECLAISETERPTIEDLKRLLVAYVRTDDARVRMATHFETEEPTSHGIGAITLTPEQIHEALSEKHNLRTRADYWVARLIAGAGKGGQVTAKQEASG
jgi:hypothetical protein